MNMITVSLTLPETMLTSVYALLGGAASVAAGPAPTKAPAPSIPVPLSANMTEGEVMAAAPVAAQADPAALTGAVEVDSAGTPWDPARHASTKTTTKDGLWRMKVGVARPANEGLAPGAPTAPPPPAPPPVVVAAVDADDEFAQFRTATVAGPAPVEAPRSWSDADLSKLCNQGAVKDGNPDRVKAIIVKYVPEGEVPHSRNIAPANREAFASEVETTLDIQYAG